MRAILVASLVVLASRAFAVEPAEQFSADQVMTVSGKTFGSKVYVDRGNMRTELHLEGAPEMVSIVNAEKSVVWMLMPGNMYVEHSIAQDDDVSRKTWTSPESREELGSETINGQVCNKYRIKGDQELFFYTNRDTGLPVLMTSGDGKVRVEWQNAKPGPQPGVLFELPAGLQKLSLPAIPGFRLPGLK